MSLSLVRLPTHMDGFLYPLGKILNFLFLSHKLMHAGNKDVYSYVSKPKTVVENYLKGDKHGNINDRAQSVILSSTLSLSLPSLAKWRESRHYSSDSDNRRPPDDRKVFIKRATSKSKNGRDTRRVTPDPNISRRTAFSRSSTLDSSMVVKGYNNTARMDKVVKFKMSQTMYDQTNIIKRSTEDKSQNTAKHFEK